MIFIYVSDEVDWGKTRLLPRVDLMLISVAKKCHILYKTNQFLSFFCILGENRRPVFCGGSLACEPSSLTARAGVDGYFM